MEELWIWLSLRPGMTKLRAAKLIKAFGDPEAIYEAGEADLQSAGVTEEKLRKGLLDKDLTRARQAVETCRRNGWGIVDIMHPDYPEKLKKITDAPLVLYLRGKLPKVDEILSLGVVGTRNAGAYGLRQTYRMAHTVSHEGGVIVSGGALGVDTEALKAAVDQFRPCIAVVAGGLDKVYPAENEQLFDRIARFGCVMTQYLPGTPCQKFQFLDRNRLISGLSDAVLITEAPMRSGAMSTARHAKKQGRDVFAMPGPITEDNFTGCHDLIRNHGAILVDNAMQIVEKYRECYPDLGKKWEAILTADIQLPTPSGKNKIDKKFFSGYTDPHKEDPDTDSPAAAVLRALQDGPMDAQQLAGNLGMSVFQMQTVLLELELQGSVSRHAGGKYRVHIK